MANAKLTSVSIERFKSHAGRTCLELGLLNVILGRNNSGKSSVIQALLLLKQTLEFPRLDVPLRLEGYVDAHSIRELTYGWPEPSSSVDGPSFSIEWEGTIDIVQALADLGSPDKATLASKAKLSWLLVDATTPITTANSLTLDYGEQDGKTILRKIVLRSVVLRDSSGTAIEFKIERETDGSFNCYFGDEPARQLSVSLEHFIPFVSINRRNVGPRDRQRSWANAFYILFVESLEDLKGLIKGFAYLSSSRHLPRSLYSPSTEPIDSIGVSGEFAEQLLQSHQNDYVHYMLPQIGSAGFLPEFRQKPLGEAVNEVLRSIGVDAAVSIEEIKNAGFRLLFGRASIQHVGRGLTYLLPLIQLGLVSDPMRFKFSASIGSEEYDQLSYAVCAFEEPEAHVHPKVQSGLAQWFVALAMGRRQVIVETHSDHLVRKLRSLVATSLPDSIMEKWLLANVRIVSVAQQNGISDLTISSLTREGGVENWPSDFMDESTQTEQDIYFASLDKDDPSTHPDSGTGFVHHDAASP